MNKDEGVGGEGDLVRCVGGQGEGERERKVM